MTAGGGSPGAEQEIGLDDFIATIFRKPFKGIVALCSGEEHFLARRFVPGKTDWEPQLYFCISTIVDVPDGAKIGRGEHDLVETHVIVLDDINTKVAAARIGLPPSYRLETSPGNEQWGFILREPVAPAAAAALIESLAATGLTDKGAQSATRVMRVPGSMNLKQEKPFAARLLNWNPERRFTLAELETGLDVVAAEQRGPYVARPLGEREADPVYEWLFARGHVQGEIKSSGWYQVRCPWVGEHTHQVDDGAGYKPGKPGAFRCHHSHGPQRNTDALRRWIMEQDPDADLATYSIFRRHKSSACNTGPTKMNDDQHARGPSGSKGDGDADTSSSSPAGSGDTAFQASDQGLADGFAAEDWRYVAKLKRWLHWTGKFWQTDEVGAIGRAVARHIKARASAMPEMKPTTRTRANSMATERAVVNKVSERADVACTTEGWDSDPMLFNTPEGTYDLNTGELRTHDRGDRITNMAATSEGGDDAMWSGFIEKIMEADRDKIAYLQRAAGYMLTGSVAEHALFLFWGDGANGKTTFVEALQAAVGSYGGTGAPDMLIEQKHAQHPADVADLYGKRLVSNEETQEGRAWSERKVKRLTGGGRVKARFMRQDFFEFEPTFKLIVQTNHKPVITNTGAAMRRRLHLVPFRYTVPAAERDTGLKEKLLANIGAVTRWALVGAAMWRKDGLAPPPVIVRATDDYLAEEDDVGSWMDACVVGGRLAKPKSGGKCHVRTVDVSNSYAKWCDAEGREPIATRRLFAELTRLGFKRSKSDGYEYFETLQLIQPRQVEGWDNPLRSQLVP